MSFSEKNRDLEEAGKKLANLNLGEGEGQDEKAGGKFPEIQNELLCREGITYVNFIV